MDEIVIIKKYANRRLYNTETSAYVTLEDLAQMVRDGREFEVVDAKTGTDITHQVLTQIIFEEENRGTALMPIKFLRNIIRFYDHNMQHMVPHYLEMMMDVFNQNQEKLRSNAQRMFGFWPVPGMSDWEKMQQQNMELMQKTFSMMNPFAAMSGAIHAQDEESKEQQIADLKTQVEQLNKEIARLKK